MIVAFEAPSVDAKEAGATREQQRGQPSNDRSDTNTERLHGVGHLLSGWKVVPAPLVAGPESAPLEVRRCPRPCRLLPHLVVKVPVSGVRRPTVINLLVETMNNIDLSRQLTPQCFQRQRTQRGSIGPPRADR